VQFNEDWAGNLFIDFALSGLICLFTCCFTIRPQMAIAVILRYQKLCLISANGENSTKIVANQAYESVGDFTQ
jgi:hypothetical protein